jgi:hypothetical protein
MRRFPATGQKAMMERFRDMNGRLSPLLSQAVGPVEISLVL